MAKKINPIIYRIGTKDDWKFKFIEKKQIEYKIFSLNSIEIYAFLKIYFFYNGLNVTCNKVFLNKNVLYIFIIFNYYDIYRKLKNNSFFVINYRKIYKKSINFITKLKKIYKLKLKRFSNKKNNLIVKKTIKIASNYNKLSIKKGRRHKIINRSNIFTYIIFLKFKQKNKIKSLLTNLFLNQLIRSLQLYFRDKIVILLILKQIIKNNFITKCNKKTKKNTVLDIVKIRKFEKNYFFKEVINTVFRSQFLNKKSYFLSSFLQLKLNKLKKLKSINYLLYFLKSSIKYFLQKYKIIKGVKIIISGNFSKKQRATKKIITSGSDINYLKLNSKLNYSESTCYTKKGIFGIKLYIQ